MLARLLLAGALGMGIITFSSSANAKSADNGSVTLTGIDRIGNGHAAARLGAVRLAWGSDGDHDRDHRHRCFDPDHDDRDCDHKHHKHRSHHHQDD